MIPYRLSWWVEWVKEVAQHVDNYTILRRGILCDRIICLVPLPACSLFFSLIQFCRIFSIIRGVDWFFTHPE